MKTKLKILTGTILLGVIGCCSAIQQTNQVPDTTSKAGKSVSSQPTTTFTIRDYTVLAAKPKGDEKPRGNKANNSTDVSSAAEGIGKKAKLTSEQVKKLRLLETRKFKAIIPTYIPTGFKVDKLNIEEKIPCRKNTYDTYSINYRNSSGSSFTITGASNCCMCGAEPTKYKTRQLFSKTFGQIILEYTDFDQNINASYIGALIWLPNKTNVYYFYSNKNVISLKDAIKIVESLQYLNP